MECPACGTGVPSGRSACPRCGTPLPSAGERFGPAPYSTDGAPQGPQAGSSNPGTEPLPIPAWDADEERPWNAPPDLPPPAGADGMPPDSGNATQILGPPGADPMPPEPPPAPWNLGTPAADPMPPSTGWGPGAPADPMPPATPWNLGAPAADPMPPEPPATGWNPGPPGAGPAPFESPPAPWSPGPTGAGPTGAGPTPHKSPVGQAAGQPFGGPAPGLASPGYQPNGWDQGIPPAAGETTGAPSDADRKKKRTILLAGGIAAAVVVVGGLVYALTQGSSGGGTPTSHQSTANTDTAAQQAAAVDKILGSGQAARGHLPSRLRTCDDVSAGVAGFQQVVRDRQQEVARTKALKVDRLPNGSRLRQSMLMAYQNSLEADQAYLGWARNVRARNCGGRIAPLVAPYHDALTANDKAGPAKRRVVALWKPIASAHGLPAYAWNRL
ncbi:hypothetical protein [Actinoallomurus sp. NPDC052274]|uniref:hypothetical protein n=1 Tax=Actinoallomurus sp. NPDC052274 TaxID=3155420 RepID=UPI0034150267